mgnify:CR=1 FL=1
MLRLSSVGSVRRLAHQWVDLSKHKRNELLSTLDTDSRLAVIEEIVNIKSKRKNVKPKSR